MARLLTAIGIALAASAAGCLTPDGYYRPDGGGGATAAGGASAQGGSSGATGSGGAMTGTGGASTGSGGATSGTGGAPTGAGGSVAGTGGNAGGGKGGAGALGGATGTGGTVVGTGGSVSSTGAAGSSGCKVMVPLPYSDDFESYTVGMPPSTAKWIFDTIDSDTSKGTFTVVSDGGSKVLQGAANSSDWIMDIGGDECWTDYTFQVDIKLVSGSSYEFGVFGRFALGTDKGNYYTAYMDDTGAVQLRVRLAGSTTTLGTKSKSTTGAPVVGMVYTFALDLHGSTISVSVNGTPRVTMVMDTTLTAGGIGLIVNDGTVEFDNVKVTQ
jgi:hypothetical protein